MTEERLVAEIDPDLKKLVKSDPRTIKEIVESSLEREFQTIENAAIQRRIDEKEQRITTLKREINDRNAELVREEDELARLESLSKRNSNKKEQRLTDAREQLHGVPRNTDNPAIKNWASKLSMTPEELIDEL